MNITVPDKLMDDPDVAQLGMQYILKGGKIQTVGDQLLLEFSPQGELSVSKPYVELLIAKGAEFGGACRFYAEVADDFLDVCVPAGWPCGDILDDTGTNIGTRPWREQCITIPGDLGTSLIMFVDLINGANGDPAGMTQERFLRYRAIFPAYFVAGDLALWVAANVDEDAAGV